jgi:hypothetical protein
MNSYGVAEVVLIVLVIAILSVVKVIPCWRILARAGFTPWLSILIILPLLDLILLYYVGFADWPARTGKTAQP